MTLDELYNYYGFSWVNVSRELRVGSNTVFLWRKKGAIPIRAQKKIEWLTDGLFKAEMETVQK